METTIKSVRVKDIILDETHDSYISADSIGTIYYKEIMGDDTNLPVIHIPSLPTAQPLFSFVKNYPLKDEIVLIIESQGKESPIHNDQKYYFPTLNILGHNHHNAFPFHLINPKPQLEKYKETVNGIIRQPLSSEPELNLGEYFKEKSTIRPLRPYEGDIILEGRFGNSIRFGSTVDSNKSLKLNKWSDEGEIGDPITIIRNGQGTSGNIGYVQTIEDINLDDSSIYLTSNQKIKDFIPSSIHFKSWGANLVKVKSILNPVLDQQIEPEIIEQPLPEVEEPVIVEPVVPPEEDTEEEISNKTFEDSSNMTEDDTDFNKITPTSTIILNKGTFRRRIENEDYDPAFIEFQEVNLNQPIGTNFTLKHLIRSHRATNPEFGIHEEAELERVGIYFHSTGESPTGVVEGYYIKDILGFYSVDGGFMNHITIKDSDMNIIHETEGSFSLDLQTQLEMAESALFSAGSIYYPYNMPNPGINNYPGIDSDLILGEKVVSNLKKVMENCIDKIIEAYPDLEIVSAYRSMEVNNSVDTSVNNDHTKGYAIDFKVPGINTAELFNWCADNIEEWKDLMWAYPERGTESWIHISYEEGKNENHSTLATEIDSIHEWYESDRRGEKQQYQDGILGANHSLICEAGTGGGGNSAVVGGCTAPGDPTFPVGDGQIDNPIKGKIRLSGTPYIYHTPGIDPPDGHQALDLGAKTGTKIYAMRDGNFKWRGDGYNGGCGGTLGVTDMKLNNGTNIDAWTCHAWKPAMHPTENRELKHGDSVIRGQHIGYSGGGPLENGTWPDSRAKTNQGYTQPRSGSPHLHYVVKEAHAIIVPWHHLTYETPEEKSDDENKEKYKKWDEFSEPYNYLNKP